MKLKKNELASILQEVEEEIAGLLKNESEALAKAGAEEPEPEGEGSAPAEGGPEASASAPPEASDPAASPAPAGPEASAPAPEASAAAPDAPGPEGSDPAAAGPVDPEALKAEYMQLPPEELKAHYMAAKAALFELMGQGGSAAPGAEASAPAPAGPEASAPAPPAPGGPAPAMKAEVPASMKNNPANGGTKQDAVPGAIHKAESAEVAELNQKVELLTKAVDLALNRNRPERKAITGVSGVSFIAKAEEPQAGTKEPSKAEVKEKIRTAMASGKLNKSEKDLLFSYGMGNVGFDQIADVLNKK